MIRSYRGSMFRLRSISHNTRWYPILRKVFTLHRDDKYSLIFMFPLWDFLWDSSRFPKDFFRILSRMLPDSWDIYWLHLDYFLNLSGILLNFVLNFSRFHLRLYWPSSVILSDSIWHTAGFQLEFLGLSFSLELKN